jgi:hypothetical protein
MRRSLLVAVVVATLAASSCSGGDSLGGSAPGAAPGGSADDAALPRLSVHQPDVPAEYQVVLYPDGDKVVNEVTLDLCAASFPSEALRIARRQTAVVDSAQHPAFSTEAVGYQSEAATAQAFRELRDAQTNCPAGFVPSGTAGTPLRTLFNPAPDKGWAPPPAGIERLVFDMFVVDEQGLGARTAAIYLRRGRILLGLYYYLIPDEPFPAVEGQTTVEAISALFANRMSQLSPKVVGG